jgi:hypothetical protein
VSVAGLIEELHLLRLCVDGAELLPGTEGLVVHGPVVQLAKLRAHERTALSGLNVLEIQDPVDGPVDLDVGPGLELVGRDHGR